MDNTTFPPEDLPIIPGAEIIIVCPSCDTEWSVADTQCPNCGRRIDETVN